MSIYRVPLLGHEAAGPRHRRELNMKSTWIAAAAAALAFTAPASAATTISGTSTLSFRTADPGLVISASPIPFNVVLNNVGDTLAVPVINIGTPEGTVNTNFLSLFGEDTVHYPITATFAFTSPLGATGPALTGSTFGFIRLFSSCGALAGGCGRVEWDAPQTFTFGNGGSFKLALNNVEFATPGSNTVNGTFTLLNSGVPEPSTWAMMIVGIGLLGGAMRRRKVTVAYA